MVFCIFKSDNYKTQTKTQSQQASGYTQPDYKLNSDNDNI